MPKLVEVMKCGDGKVALAPQIGGQGGMQATLRATATRILGQMGRSAFSAIEDLEQACGDPSKSVACAAKESLGKLRERARCL